MTAKEIGNTVLNGFWYGFGFSVALFLVSMLFAFVFHVRLIGP